MPERARGRRGPAQTERSKPAADAPASSGSEPLVARLQRQVGNRAVSKFLRGLQLQRFKEGDGPAPDVGVIQQQLNHVVPTMRVAITGIFDASTTATAKAFQHQLIAETIAGVTEDGVVAGETHNQLKTRAPSVNISDNDTVQDSAGHSQNLFTPALGTHEERDAKGVVSDLATGAKGTGVKELQQRINNSPTMADAARLARDGEGQAACRRHLRPTHRRRAQAVPDRHRRHAQRHRRPGDVGQARDGRRGLAGPRRVRLARGGRRRQERR